MKKLPVFNTYFYVGFSIYLLSNNLLQTQALGKLQKRQDSQNYQQMNSTLPRLKGHFSFQKRTDILSIAFKWSKCNSTICLHYFFTFCLLSLLCSLKSNPPKEVYILEADFVQPLKSLLFSWTSQPQAVKSSSFCFLRY